MSGVFHLFCLRWDLESHRRADIARSFVDGKSRDDGGPGVKGVRAKRFAQISMPLGSMWRPSQICTSSRDAITTRARDNRAT